MDVAAPTFHLLEIPSGTTIQESWDARTLELGTECLDCRTVGGGVSSIPIGTPTPSDPGRYTVTVPFTTALPDGCSKSGMCTLTDPQGAAFAPMSTCLPANASAEFDLPPSGDITVDVVL
jgi:hypothetical protein